MTRGFLAGAFWGSVCGIALLAVASQTVAPRSLSFPRPEATPVEVPGGSEFDQARPETDPVVSEGETSPRGAGVATGVVVPEDAGETPPAFDTSSIEAPETSLETPGGLGSLPDLQDDAAIDVTGPGDQGGGPSESPDLPQPDNPGASPAPATNVDASLTAPETGATPTDITVEEETAPDVASDVSAPAAPEAADSAVQVEAPALPATDTSGGVQVLVAPDAGTDAPTLGLGEAKDEAPTIGLVEAPQDLAIETDSPRLPQITAAPEPTASDETDTPDIPQPVAVDTAPAAPGVQRSTQTIDQADQIGDLASNVTTDRLPRIGVSEEQDEAAAAPEDTPLVVEGGALQAYANAFSNPENKPMLSVVLVQVGTTPLDSSLLSVLPESVGLAVEAQNSDAGSIAATYREAGREVVLIPNVPEGARPQDVEVTLKANFLDVPEAVAIMDASGRGLQANRAAVAQVVDIIETTGHGLITFPRGLNTAHQRAEQQGVPAGLIFRDLDGDGQDIDQIKRAFDRAAFRARQNEAVILVGTTQEVTVQAIREWSLGNRAATVALAPISAALMVD